MSSPLSGLVENYLNLMDNISAETKDKVKEILNGMLTGKIDPDDGVHMVIQIIGYPGPSEKIYQIMSINNPNKDNKHFGLKLKKIDNGSLSDIIRTSQMGITKKKMRNSSKNMGKLWSEREDNKLLYAINKYGFDDWGKIASFVGNNRTKAQCSQRWCRGLDPNLVKGPWTEEEEAELLRLVGIYGEKNWLKISNEIVKRSDAQCRYHFLQIQKRMKRNSKNLENPQTDPTNMNKDLKENEKISILPTKTDTYFNFEDEILQLFDLNEFDFGFQANFDGINLQNQQFNNQPTKSNWY